MPMLSATEDPLYSQKDEQKIGQGVDNLSGVDGRIIIL